MTTLRDDRVPGGSVGKKVNLGGLDGNGNLLVVSGDTFNLKLLNKSIVAHCEAAADCITDETAALAAEMHQVLMPANCVGVEITLDAQQLAVIHSHNAGANDITYAIFPRARGALVSIGAENSTAAAARMSKATVAPGTQITESSSDTLMVSPSIVLQKSWAKGTVDYVHVGFLDSNSAVYNSAGTAGNLTDIVVGAGAIAKYVGCKLNVNAICTES